MSGELFSRYNLKIQGTYHEYRRSRQGGGVSSIDRGDILDLMHGRSRMAVDPRIPTMPGWIMSDFLRSGRQTLFALSAKGREVSGESHAG